MAEPLLIVSKSEWEPSVRREHAWARLAVAHGHPTTFLERPSDLRTASGTWVRRLRRPAFAAAEGVRVAARSTVVPGHHSSSAGLLDAGLTRQHARIAGAGDASVVCCLPWHWPAVAAAPARRRVFDLADDWGELMAGRGERFAALYERIAAEADAIVVVNPDLARHFPDRSPVVIRNGVAAASIVAAGPGAPRTMVYVGTLTPRFDAPLMAAVLERLTDWTLELVGQCLYPGLGDRPADELASLLANDRVTWHGPQPRSDAFALLDRAAVAVIPNRPERSLGQDSMKLYDYTARARPIVSTAWSPRLTADGPPVLSVAAGADDFATAVRAAAGADVTANTAWVREHSWDARWPAWSAAVFG